MLSVIVQIIRIFVIDKVVITLNSIRPIRSVRLTCLEQPKDLLLFFDKKLDCYIFAILHKI